MRFRILTVALLLTSLSCGGANPGNPSGGGTGSGGGGGPAGNKGTVTATINGASFTGYVPAGSSVLRSGPPQILDIGAVSADNTTLGFAVLAAIGTTSVGIVGGLPSPTNALLAAPGPSTALWVANVTGGSGTVTVQTLTATGATGTFSFPVMIPSPGSGATGNRAVLSGAFTVTF